MKKLLKKILLSFLVFLTIFMSFAPYSIAKAQTWYNQGFTEWYSKVYDESMSPSNEIFGERYTAAQVQWVIYSLVSLPLNLLGKDNQDFLNCALKYAGDQTIDVWECSKGAIGAIIGTVKRLIPNVLPYSRQDSFLARVTDTTNRPISGIGYVKSLFQKFSPISEAKAQSQGGYGYGHMTILLPYWGATRNTAFFMAVIITIAFSFMIMFRVKISPQTVISIQSAIPKLFIAILLATFSYAMAGLMIDLIYVISGVFAALLHTSGVASTFGRAYTTIVGEFSVGGISIGNILGGPITIFFVMLIYLILFFFSVVWNALTSILLSLSLITGTMFTIVGLALTVWLIVLMFIYTIRIPWILFKTTINIFMFIIIAPIQIMAGAFLPQIGFSLWLKNLFANIMVFPVTGLFIFLAFDLLMFSYTAGSVVGASGILDVVNNTFGTKLGGGISTVQLWSPPWLGQDVTGFIFLMMSFGVIIAIPKVIDILKMLIMGEKFTFGTAIGEAMAPVKQGRYPAAISLHNLGIAGETTLFGRTVKIPERLRGAARLGASILSEGKLGYEQKTGQ